MVCVTLFATATGCGPRTPEYTFAPVTGEPISWDDNHSGTSPTIFGQTNNSLEDALESLNTARTGANLHPATAQDQLNEAAKAHADYLLINQDIYLETSLSAHEEVAGLPGFTGESFLERLAYFEYPGIAFGEVVAFKPNPHASIESWLESLYHRLMLLHPAMTELGYAHETANGVGSGVMDLGLGDADPDSLPAFIMFPLPGTKDVPFQWNGMETPQPPAPPLGYPSGPVLTLRVKEGGLSYVHASVTREDLQIEVAGQILTHENDPNLSPFDVAIIPHRPLTEDTPHTVRVQGEHALGLFDISWSFRTRSKSCSLNTQDCSGGRACYPTEDGPRCLWEGNSGPGGSCQYANDCHQGMACYGSQCLALCEQSDDIPESESCMGTCPSGHIPLYGEDGPSVCIASSCMDSGEGCGQGQACYWAGAFVCHWEGSGTIGSQCQSFNDCQAGLSCLGWEGSFSCRALCDGHTLEPCDSRCENDSVALGDEENPVAFCL